MEHTLPPPPPPDAPRADTFYADLLRWLARLVCYPLYRPFTHLSRHPGHALAAAVLRSLLMAGLVGSLFKLAQHGLLLWALAHRTRLDPPIRPTGPWPLTAPLADWQVVGLVAAFGLLLLLDRQNPRWPVHLTWAWPYLEVGHQDPVLILPEVDRDVLVLGRPYTRTWNELENRMETVPQEEGVYTVGQAELCTHATVVAPTRAGKTFNVTIPLIEFADRREGAGIFIDAKGDDLTGPRFDGQYPGAFHRRFNLLDEEAPRFRLQVWVGRTIHERAERLASALVRDGASEESRYFAHNARVAFRNLVLAHANVYKHEPTFPQLLTYLRNADARAELAQQVADRALKDALARIDDVRSAKRDVLGGLDTVLDPLAQPEIARFFATPEAPGYSVEDVLQARARVCFTLPVGPHPEVAPLIGRLVISQFTQAVFDPANNTDYLKLLVVEDAANFVTPLLGLALAQASSHNAAYVLIFQDLAQVRDENLIQDLLTNTGLKIVLGGIGDADSIRFSRVFGNRERLFRTQTASSGRGVGQSHSSGSHRGAGSHQRGGSQSRQQSVSWGRTPRLRPEFTASELRELPDHHAVIERRDQRGHLTTATLVHFDAGLQRLLTQQQRQMLLGPYAEPLNHLHPFFPQRSAANPAPSQSPPPVPEARAPQREPERREDAAPLPAVAAPPAAAPPAPEPPAAAAPTQAAVDTAAPPIAPAPRPRRRITTPLPADDLPASLAGGCLIPAREPGTGSAPNDLPARQGSPAARPAPAPLVQAVLPFASGALPTAPPPPARAGNRAVPPAPPADPALDPATGAQWLIKQLALDAESAGFLAETAARNGHTPASFAALLTQVRALPEGADRFAVLYQHLTRPLAATPEDHR